jgi:hypothetical protein
MLPIRAQHARRSDDELHGPKDASAVHATPCEGSVLARYLKKELSSRKHHLLASSNGPALELEQSDLPVDLRNNRTTAKWQKLDNCLKAMCMLSADAIASTVPPRSFTNVVDAARQQPR